MSSFDKHVSNWGEHLATVRIQRHEDSHQCVQRFICGFPSFQPVIYFVSPRPHLNGTDKVRLDDSFLV